MLEPRLHTMSRQKIAPIPMLEARPCLVASFELGDAFFTVSKYDDELEWLADSASGAGLPTFSHGAGQRSTLKHCISTKIGQWLDKEAAALPATAT